VISICIQLHRIVATAGIIMAVFVLLEDLMREKGGWRSALEECGEQYVMMGGAPLMLV